MEDMKTIESKFEDKKENIMSLIHDVESGFDGAQLSLTHLRLEDGRVIEIQINVTSDEDDFINQP